MIDLKKEQEHHSEQILSLYQMEGRVKSCELLCDDIGTNITKQLDLSQIQTDHKLMKMNNKIDEFKKMDLTLARIEKDMATLNNVMLNARLDL
jgi:hypothetical protein